MKKRLGLSGGFTLLELLIVISIIAILSVVVILVLNPSEMLKKARDSQRMADLNTIKTAVGLYLVGTNIPYLGLNGNSNTGCSTGSRNIWFSKSGVSGTVDTDATATSSVSQSIAGKTNGSGWIPVNLSSLSGGSPISNWPIDPVNSVANLSSPAATDLVYRYGCNSASQFEVNATLESNAFTIANDKRVSDGGDNSSLYESGTNLAIMHDPSGSGQAGGLVAFYPFSEGTGSITADSSGNGNTGSLMSSPVWTGGKYGGGLLFDGGNYVDLVQPSSLEITGSMTVSGWIYASAFPDDDAAIVSSFSGSNDTGYQLDTTVDRGRRTIGFKFGGGGGAYSYGTSTLATGTWYYVAGVYDAVGRTMKVYLNGVLDNGDMVGTVPAAQVLSPDHIEIGQRPSYAGNYNFTGAIDEIRIYNRALSQTEIQNDMVNTLMSNNSGIFLDSAAHPYPSPWQVNHSYTAAEAAAGLYVLDGGNTYQLTTAGTSGGIGSPSTELCQTNCYYPDAIDGSPAWRLVGQGAILQPIVSWVAGANSTTLTTRAFNSSADATLVVAVVTGEIHPSNLGWPTAGVSWTGGTPPGATSFTKAVGVAQAGTANDGAEIWTASVSSALTGVSVSATAGSSLAFAEGQLNVYVLKGASTILGNTSTYSNDNASSPYSTAINASALSSWLFVGVTNGWNVGLTPTPSGAVLTESGSVSNGASEGNGYYSTPVLGSNTIGGSESGYFSNVAALEVKAQ